MTSAYANEWVSAIAQREFHHGIATGFLLGVMLSALVVALVVAKAMSEVET